jgi:HK97 gp10 family phage protein
MSIEFRGLENVLDRLDSVTDISTLKRAMGRACALVERSAKQKAPKDTGALRRSITSEVNATGSDVIGTVFTPLEYAPYIEYGTGLFAESTGRQDAWSYKDDKGNWHTTSGQKPQPFMRPALNENRERITEILKEGLAND